MTIVLPTRKLKFRLASGMFLLALISNAQDTLPEIKKNKADFVITTRLHSTGHFPYTGSYVNRHLNVDINLFYQHKSAGVFLFKSHDLEEPKGIINYLQPGIFKNFVIGMKGRISLYGGYIFNQTSRFSDKDSDAWVALIGSWQFSKVWKIENTSLFFNLTKSELNHQLANRTVVSVWLRDFKFEVYLWHNVVFETGKQFTSAALAVSAPEIRISEKIKLIHTLSVQSYLTNDKPSYAMRHGFLFTMAVPFVVAQGG